MKLNNQNSELETGPSGIPDCHGPKPEFFLSTTRGHLTLYTAPHAEMRNAIVLLCFFSYREAVSLGAMFFLN